MISYGRLGRVGAAVAAAGLVFGLTAIPASSQSLPEEIVTLTGSAECQDLDGTMTWVISYNLHNNIDVGLTTPSAFGDVTVDSAVVSVDGSVLGPTDFEPNPVPAGGDATDGGPVPGFITGTFTLTLDWSAESIDDSGTETLDLVLDDSCVAPVTTSSEGPGVQAVDVVPAFTG